MKYDAQPSKIKEPFGGFHLENDVELGKNKRFLLEWCGISPMDQSKVFFLGGEVLEVNPFCEPGC